MKKKTPIRSVAGLSNKAENKPRSKKDPLKDLSKQDIRDLLDKLTRENKELRKARKEVEASRQRYTDLYDSAPVGYFTFDRNGVVLEVNLTGAAMLGVERTKLLKTPLTLFVSKEDRDTFNTHCQKVFSTSKRQSCELEFTRKDSKTFFAELGSVRTDGETFRTAMNDTTKRKKAEEALKESEERYRGIFDRANDGIIAYDLNSSKFLYVNISMSELTGYSREEILKLGVKDLHPEKDFPFVLKEFEVMASGEKTVTKDIPVLKKDGSVIYCDIGSSFLGKTTLLGFFREMTDRKLAEDRTNHFASFPQLNPNPVMEADAAGKVIFCNPATPKILESMGLNEGDTAVFLPADLEQIIKKLGKKEEASFYREVVVKDRIFGETVYLPFQAKTARIYAYEITERKQAEKALQRAHDELESRVQERTRELEEAYKTINSEKQRFYDVLEMLPTYVVLLTADYHVPFANSFFRERFGDSGGRCCYEYLFERTEPCEICETFNVLKTNAPHHWEWTGPDDRNYDVFAFPFKDADGSPLIMEVGIDITEVKQAEKTLREMNETLEQRIAERTAELESSNVLLLRSQEDMTRAQEVGSIGSWRLDVRQNLLAWSDENHRIFGIPKGSPMTYETFLSTVHPEDQMYVDAKWKAGLAGDTYDIEHRIVVYGAVKWVREKAYIEFDENNELLGALGITQDITERKLAEEALIKSESKYRSLFTNMINGFALQEIITDASGKPVDYTFIEVNPAFEKITGLKEKEVIGRRVTEVLPGIENDPAGWIAIYGRVALTGEDCRFEQFSARLGRWFSISAFSPMYGFFVAIFEDVTLRKQMEEELLRSKNELELRVKERTAELFEKSRLLESFFTHTQTCLVFLDRHFNFIRVNEAYAKVCSREVTDFEGRNHFIEFPSEALTERFQQVVETKKPYSVSKQPFAFPDHPEWETTYWDFTVAPVLDAEGDVDFLVLSMLDVTDRVQAEAQIFHLNRLYGMLSEVNTSILRIRETDELYRQLCRIAVEEGRFRMAWIGLVDPATNKVVHAYSYGDTGGYLDSITISAADVPEGMGPTGRAIREGRTMICSDVEYDPIMLPWKDKAIKQGFRSAAAIPLRLGGSVIGAFTIYAGTPQFFTDEELELLVSLADNISFAINAMSNEKMRLDAEATLRQSAEEIQDLYNNAPCGYHLLDKDGTIVRINDTELKWLGCSREEVVGKKKIYEFYTPESVETFKTRYPEFVEHGSVGEVEVDILRRDDPVLSMLIKSTAIRDKDGNFLMCRSTLFDITDRKEAEQRIMANNELLKLFARKYSLGEYLDAACDLVRKWSGCRHAGFRIIDEKGEIPFLASIDYAPDFLKREDNLSLVHDQCICTRIIAGSPESSDLAFMTPGGSFISGNTSSFIEMLPGEQRSKYRNVCMQAGFKSLAVVPIRYRGQVLGALHIADELEAALPLKKLEFIEQLAVIVGEAINRFSAEEELRKSREELRNLNKYLRDAREIERTAIAREIHDELGQIITALRLGLAWIRDHYKEDQVIFDKSKSMLALVDATIQTIQNIITELRPGILDVLGLFAAIEWQAAELKKMSGITCDLSLPSEDVLVDAEISTNIFRIIQELFTNIVRYSQATNVSVRIEIRERLFLNVTDNGIGIRPQDISSPVSFGIIGIRERVYAMKGEMDITGTSGMGTSISIAVPVNAGQSAQPGMIL